ncbi:unnamed protein product [Leptosia nina]|uniref:Secreted protein n=1 Tax=Leptosia nina TaxID=320188 RepID=A0AAV1JDI7_9NEOP
MTKTGLTLTLCTVRLFLLPNLTFTFPKFIKGDLCYYLYIGVTRISRFASLWKCFHGLNKGQQRGFVEQEW